MISSILAMTLSLAPVSAAPGQTPAEPAAGAWLGQVDAGRYADAWSSADPLVQVATTQAAFSQGLRGAREPLGRELSRTLVGVRSETSLPGAPDGLYVVMTYDTRFGRKAGATETLILRKEADGWKASGYFIR